MSYFFCHARGRFSLIVNLLFLAVLLCGCASNRTLTLDQDPGCQTSIEGYYHSRDPWDKAKPALVFRQGRDMKVLAGEIESRDEKGVTFDPSPEGYIGDPKPEYFEFRKIETLIDENGKVIYGSIPEVYSRAYALVLHLNRLDDPESKPVEILLKPNKRFGFCVKPGKYKVSKIEFKNDYRMMVDEGVDIPELILSVTENRSNYIGDIYLDCAEDKHQEPIVVQYKVSHRQPGSTGDDYGSDDFLVQMLGGIVAEGIYAAAKEASKKPGNPKGIVGAHLLFIEKNDEFKVKGAGLKTDNIMEYSKPAYTPGDQSE